MAVCPLCDHNGALGEPCPTHDDWRLVDELQLEKYRKKGVLLGRLVADRFAVVRVLGRGGMGWVYEAIQEPIGRRIALKVLRADHASDEIVRSRFFREAKVLGMLQHPNLVTLYDYGVLEVTPHPAMGGLEGADPEQLLFIGMELLRGQTLRDVLGRPRLLAGARLLRIVHGIAGGLAEAHRNQVVHRDLKPENVLLVRDSTGMETVKLVDFGIARLSTASTVLTQTGMVFGTPAYMSPEQAAGEVDVGPEADSYAFGILLYKMLTDRLPFTGDKPLQLLMQQINKPPPAIVLRDGIVVPESLLELCEACLEKAPGDRPVDGPALLHALEAAQRELENNERLVKGAREPVDGLEASTARGNISAADAVADIDSDLGETDPEMETIVVGGGVKIDAITDVDSPTHPALPSGDAAVPTEPSVPAATADGQEAIDTWVTGSKTPASAPRDADELREAYRVAPRTDGPSELRSGGVEPKWFAIGGGVLLVLVVVLVVALSGGDGDEGDGGDGSETETEAPATGGEGVDPSAPTDDEATERPGPSDPPVDTDDSEVPDDGEGEAGDPAGPTDDALLEELARLEGQLETQLMTATDDDHRREIQSAMNRQIAPIRAELARRGVEVEE